MNNFFKITLLLMCIVVILFSLYLYFSPYQSCKRVMVIENKFAKEFSHFRCKRLNDKKE